MWSDSEFLKVLKIQFNSHLIKILTEELRAYVLSTLGELNMSFLVAIGAVGSHFCTINCTL